MLLKVHVTYKAGKPYAFKCTALNLYHAVTYNKQSGCICTMLRTIYVSVKHTLLTCKVCVLFIFFICLIVMCHVHIRRFLGKVCSMFVCMHYINKLRI